MGVSKYNFFHNHFKSHITPTGAVDGVNTVFVLPGKKPVEGTEYVHVNGVVSYPTSGYTIVDNTITFVTAPVVDDEIDVSYWI